jgi:hypothetical protein
MRHLSKGLAALGAAALVLAAGGCNKGPAEDALAAADQALAAARPDLARYTPDELSSLNAAVADARSQLEQGHYTEALKVAQGLPARIDAAAAAADAKKEVLEKAWAGIADVVPPAIERLAARLAELAARRTPPGEAEARWLAAARTDLDGVARAWTEAGEAFAGGDVPRAVRMAQDVRASIVSLSDRLGLASAPAPPAPAAQ